MSPLTCRRLALILAAALLPACQGNEPNAAGPAGAAAGPVGVASPEEASVSWSRDLWPLFQVRCQICHTSGDGAAKVPDMRMTNSAALYDEWVRIFSKCNVNLYRIFPGQVELSFVWDKLAHVAPMCGERMPLEGAPLDEADLRLLRLWIEQGARRN